MRFLKKPQDGPQGYCYFTFGKSSEVQNKSQMRKLSWMPNVFLNPIQKKFLLKFFLTAFENEAQCPVCLQFQRRCPFRTNSSMPTNLLILCAWDMCSYQVCKFVMSSNMQPFKRATTWATDSRCWGGSCSIQRGEWLEGHHTPILYVVERTCRRAFTQTQTHTVKERKTYRGKKKDCWKCLNQLLNQ